MELREYAGTIWKWSWLIVLATLIAAFAAWWTVKDQPDIFQTSTTLMIGQAIQKVDPNYSDFYTSERLAQTYSELIKREPILKNTAKALGFEDQWTRLRGQISVNLIPGTQLMELRVTDNDPQRAKLIADEVSRQLMSTVERSRPQDRNREFIQTQSASLPPKIQAAQQEIEELQAELSEAFSARQIQDIQNRINTLESQINNWQATFAQYQLLLGETGDERPDRHRRGARTDDPHWTQLDDAGGPGSRHRRDAGRRRGLPDRVPGRYPEDLPRMRRERRA